jgi:hypothetical protein
MTISGMGGRENKSQKYSNALPDHNTGRLLSYGAGIAGLK